MSVIGIYDTKKKIYNQISSFGFWNKSPGIQLLEPFTDRIGLRRRIGNEAPQIFFMADYPSEPIELLLVREIHSIFRDMKIVMISGDTSFKTVRAFFVAGCSDYLKYPFSDEEFSSCIASLEADDDKWFYSSCLEGWAGELIRDVFAGGGHEREYIEKLISEIVKTGNGHTAQLIRSSEQWVFDDMVSQKPWLGKFLNRSDFSNEDYKDQKKAVEDWYRSFSKASEMVRRYRLIDDNPVVYRIGKYAVEHVDEKLSLSSVSGALYLNSNYISHLFKEITGQTFTAYLGMVKIDRAKVLLESGMRIKDVAIRLEYPNEEYFSRVFKKITGMSPREYLRSL